MDEFVIYNSLEELYLTITDRHMDWSDTYDYESICANDSEMSHMMDVVDVCHALYVGADTAAYNASFLTMCRILMSYYLDMWYVPIIDKQLDFINAHRMIDG